MSGEIVNQIQFAIEQEQSRFAPWPVQDWVKYGRQPRHPAEFSLSAAPDLDRNHERDRVCLRCLVQMNRLLDAIILDDEVLRLQSVDSVPGSISHQRRHRHQGTLRPKTRLLLTDSSTEKQQKHQQQWADSEHMERLI